MSGTEAAGDEIEERFDSGDDVLGLFDLEMAKHPNRELRRVNVDLSGWMVNTIDDEAKRLGTDRQAIIRMWVAEHLERTDRAAAAQ